MPLTTRFNPAAQNLVRTALREKTSGKRPAPFSLRLSAEERARLAIEAAGAPLGTYIRVKLLSGEVMASKRRKGLTIQDREALAQALALLGRSGLSDSLAGLADAVSIGALPVTPETERELRDAVRDVSRIRTLLLTALGHKPGPEQ